MLVNSKFFGATDDDEGQQINITAMVLSRKYQYQILKIGFQLSHPKDPRDRSPNCQNICHDYRTKGWNVNTITASGGVARESSMTLVAEGSRSHSAGDSAPARPRTCCRLMPSADGEILEV